MAGVGIGYNELVNKPEQRAQQKANADIAAARTQFSPYTGHGAGNYQAQQGSNSLGTGLQMGFQGMNLAQSMNNNEKQNKMYDEQMKYMQNVNNTHMVNGAMNGIKSNMSSPQLSYSSTPNPYAV